MPTHPQRAISTCVSTGQLANTGLDTPDEFGCGNGSLEGSGTGWLETRGNVVSGEIITLRIAIWDTTDASLDSAALIMDRVVCQHPR